MATLEHVELDSLQLGMPVLLGGREIGRLEDVIPQPDRRHALRLITRLPDNRLVAIPIDWVRDIRDGRIELSVTSAEIDQLPDYAPIIRAGRERMPAAVNGRTTTTATGYGYPWLHTLLERTSGLDFDETQLARIADIAERKLVDLFDVAEESAGANGRARVLRHDLPLTKGLQIVLLEVADIAREFQLQPLLVFLADAGIRTPFDDEARTEIPRLMAGLLILTARVVALLESEDSRVSPKRPSRAGTRRGTAGPDPLNILQPVRARHHHRREATTLSTIVSNTLSN